ncbi:MAG: DegV family protein [Chloroflexi bacterium]|nr:DegV family protein [Chloroflexota bacterium]
MADQRIVIVTDSTACIPQHVLNGVNVPVIPLWLIWGDERFRDGVDIDQHTFYRRLPHSKVFPTTSQPSAGEFIEFFQQGSVGADAIVGAFISSKISGTVQSALAAQDQLKQQLDIRVIDSLSTSMGLGFVVLAAIRAAAAGKSVDEVVAAAERMRERVNVLFVVDTLEYLHRGGRIGGAKRFLGTALSIKPILHLEDGSIEALTQVRTKRKAVNQLLEIIEERLAGRRIAEVAVLDVDAPTEGDSLAKQITKEFDASELIRTSVSPVIGAHAGPGTVGVVFYAEE